MFNFSALPFSKVSMNSLGEIEAHIHRELFEQKVVTVWPTAQGAHWPTYEPANKAIVPGRSYGYINSHVRDARVWFIREEDSYSIFVSKTLSIEFTQALHLLTAGDAQVVSRQDDWTRLTISRSGSLALVISAMILWAANLPESETNTSRVVEYRF